VLGGLEDEAVARVRHRSEQLPQRSLFALIGDAVEHAQSQVVEFLMIFRLAHDEVGPRRRVTQSKSARWACLMAL